VQIEELQLALENGKVLAQNDMEELELKLRLEKELRSKLQRWRESEYKNAYTMEDWRKERDVMQKVRQSPCHSDI
jgi:hypothetical protein